jgi:hypothetical protein
MTRSVEEEIESRVWSCEGGDNVVQLPISMLEPYTKILSDHHYFTVIESIKMRGLMNPLVILQIDEDEWHKEYLDNMKQEYRGILGPATFGPPFRYRVQCGNHRYYALKDYFHADVVPCEIYTELDEAAKACRKYRKYKGWKLLEEPTSLL